MNRFDAYIADYLYENKEVALENIGLVKVAANSTQSSTQNASVDFVCNKKTPTSQELINFIAQKSGKNKNLIASDLESHLTQVREFLNIGKSYEIPRTGFIKLNNKGVYEFIPYSEANKPVVTGRQPVKQRKRTSNHTMLQLFTFLIVIAILSGLGWEAYQFYKARKTGISGVVLNNADSSTNTVIQGASGRIDTNAADTQQAVTYSPDDTLNIRYIYETTASGLRARTRTAQLVGFGNNATYDSFIHNNTKFYSMYISKPTKVADTLAMKDSLAKFLQKDIKLEIEQPKR